MGRVLWLPPTDQIKPKVEHIKEVFGTTQIFAPIHNC